MYKVSLYFTRADVWIGFKKSGGQWVTTDGSDGTYLNGAWKDNEPKDNKFCVVAKESAIKSHDCDGDHGHYVVCRGELRH